MSSSTPAIPGSSSQIGFAGMGPIFILENNNPVPANDRSDAMRVWVDGVALHWVKGMVIRERWEYPILIPPWAFENLRVNTPTMVADDLTRIRAVGDSFKLATIFLSDDNNTHRGIANLLKLQVDIMEIAYAVKADDPAQLTVTLNVKYALLDRTQQDLRRGPSIDPSLLYDRAANKVTLNVHCYFELLGLADCDRQEAELGDKVKGTRGDRDKMATVGFLLHGEAFALNRAIF